MLVGFSVRNFRSFLSEQSFGFLASPDRAHEATHCIATGVKSAPRVTKAAVIFGANASGKSNLLMALRTMRELVLHSTALSDAEYARCYTPFLLNGSADLATTFDIDVLIEATRYRYRFSYAADRIVSERLLVTSKGRSQRWFGRVFDEPARSERWAPFSASFTGPRELWRRATRPKALFLTTAAQLNSAKVKPLFHWFQYQLEIVLATDNPNLRSLAMRLADPCFKSRVLNILCAADMGIEDIRVTEAGAAIATTGGSPFYRAPVGTIGEPTIEFLHPRIGAPSIWLDSQHESAGTHRLVSLLMPMLDGIAAGKLIAIDQFGSDLHPLVARLLIGLVTDRAAARQAAQLLLSSHNVALMDLDLLRRDEIWLMHLDEGRASSLTALRLQGPRKRAWVATNYLRGLYGAVPEIRIKH